MGGGVLMGSLGSFTRLAGARRAAGVLAIAAAAMVAASCNDSTSNSSCQGNPAFVDVRTNLSSQLGGAPVALFHFSQDYTVASCGRNGPIRLTITSTSSVTESFTFQAQGAGLGSGISGSVTRLSPGATIDLGVAVANPASAITDGQVAVTFSSFSTP